MFIPRILVVLALALAGGSAAAQPTNNDYYGARSTPQLAELLATVEKYHEQQGIDKLRTRFYPGAWGEFNFMLNYFPNHPRALILMGQVCERWLDPKCNMTSYFDKAVRLTPENAGIYLTQGVYLQKRGKLAEAIESYKKALELNPNSANTHYNLGLAYVTQKNFDLANEHAQEAYSRGITLPGLQNKLMQAKAWKPLPPKPVPDPTEAALADQPKPVEPTEAKPSDTEIKSNDGSK
ncbi:MAG: tetratricopeptide repeat protein [Rhodocyclaceae bacterium]|nr:tetratricopeptide repeat protein [Rhodocyclaceae bacterium]